ncbi:MAG: tetratricopeptide repeat protein [Thermoanaerobaculales bacterium]|jgi:PAS domain S-box-containing protein|nr:tetratricopeptide repeat protein [Thermoanaerobaculales bacterium]
MARVVLQVTGLACGRQGSRPGWRRVVAAAAIAGALTAPLAAQPSDQSEAEARLTRLERLTPEDGPAAYLELGRLVLADLEGADRPRAEAEVRLGVGRALRLEERFNEATVELRRSVELARRLGLAGLEASALVDLARSHFFLGEYDDAAAACRSALALPEIAADPDRAWVYHNILATIELQQGRFEAALETSSRALVEREAAGDRRAVAILLNNIGIAHMYLGDHDAALEFFHRARVIKSELGETDGVADMLANIADIKHLQGSSDEAIELHTQALELRQAEGGEARVALSHRSLAAALHGAGRDREALGHVDRALEIHRRLDLEPEVVSCLAIRAEVLAALGRTDEAVTAAQEAVDLAGTLGMKGREIVALDALVEAQVARGDAASAFEAQGRARDLENELLSSDIRREFAEFQAAFEAREMEREIELLRKDNLIKDLEIRHHRLWRSSLLVGLGLVLAIAVIGWSRFVLKQRENRERRRADEAYRSSMERYRLLFERSPAGIFQCDLGGRIVRTNQALAAVLGWRGADELVGRSIAELTVRSDEAVALLAELGDRPEVRNRELKMQTRSGEAVSVLINAGRVGDTEGAGELVEGIAIDITDRKRAEDDRRRLELELQQHQKLESLGVLAGGIAHDFNNMLMAMLSNISLAKRSVANPEERLRRLTEAEEVCLRATSLTQQLLTFSKGGRPIRRIASVRALVEEAATFSTRGGNCALDLRSSPELWPAEVDEGQVVQVVQNLVLNAVQAMPLGGTVTVTTDNSHLTTGDVPALEAGRYIRIEVADTGPGIPESRLEKIFDPFYTTKKGGSGLGLATAFSIVRSHGGAIVVRSDPDEGSRFTVYLPATDREGGAPEPRSDEVLQGSGRLLIMDDDESVRSAAAELLETIGYSVDTAADGAEAIELYTTAMSEGRSYDAVVLDLTVPEGVGGRETISRLLAVDPDVRAIVSSGYSTDPVMANYREHGFAGVAVKPYRLAELARTLRAAMDLRDHG